MVVGLEKAVSLTTAACSQCVFFFFFNSISPVHMCIHCLHLHGAALCVSLKRTQHSLSGLHNLVKGLMQRLGINNHLSSIYLSQSRTFFSQAESHFSRHEDKGFVSLQMEIKYINSPFSHFTNKKLLFTQKSITFFFFAYCFAEGLDGLLLSNLLHGLFRESRADYGPVVQNDFSDNHAFVIFSVKNHSKVSKSNFF